LWPTREGCGEHSKFSFPFGQESLVFLLAKKILFSCWARNLVSFGRENFVFLLVKKIWFSFWPRKFFFLLVKKILFFGQEN
jgi:hypothetical protein